MEKEISTTAKLYYNSGNNAADKGNYEEAIKNYSEAIRLAPNYSNAYFNRGDAFDETGEYDKAIADYCEVIRIDQSADAYLNRGVVFYKKGEDDRAIADLTEAIRIDPNYVNAYEARGKIYKSKGEMERAAADAEMALKINQNHLQNTKKEVESVADIQMNSEKIQLVYVTKSSSRINKAKNIFHEISKEYVVHGESSHYTYLELYTLHVFLYLYTDAVESEIDAKIRATGVKFLGRFNRNPTSNEIVEKLKAFKAKPWNWIRLVLAALLLLLGATGSGLLAIAGGIGVIVEGCMLLKKYNT